MIDVKTIMGQKPHNEQIKNYGESDLFDLLRLSLRRIDEEPDEYLIEEFVQSLEEEIKAIKEGRGGTSVRVINGKFV